MAKVTMRIPEDFLLKISKLGDKTDEIVPKVLESGGEVVLNEVSSKLKSSIGKNTKIRSRSTGELVSSLGLTPVLMDRRGHHNIKVGFKEPRSDGDSNAKIANILEYGRSNQASKPFLKPSRITSRAPCIEALKD